MCYFTGVAPPSDSPGNEADGSLPSPAEMAALLEELLATRMPFGKYEGRLLLDLPEPYVVWFHAQGFPKGKLGRQLGLLYEIKLNGLESMFRGRR